MGLQPLLMLSYEGNDTDWRLEQPSAKLGELVVIGLGRATK